MSRFEHPPLKRHPTLQPFSRDHYQALVQARRLIQAADATDRDRRAALAEFLDVWSHHLEPHFADEERLLTALGCATQRDRLVAEHDRLRALADEAGRRRRQIDPQADWIAALGRSLDEHVRWEERELFPSLEAKLPAKLDQWLPEAQQIEAARARGRAAPAATDSAADPSASPSEDCAP